MTTPFWESVRKLAERQDQIPRARKEMAEARDAREGLAVERITIMQRDASIFDLPVLPSGYEEVVSEAYLADRDAVQTPADLLDFTKKWESIWRQKLRTGENEPLDQAEKSILLHNYDPSEALGCLILLRNQENCPHVGTDNECVGINLAVPPFLLLVSVISAQCVLPTDPTMIQLTQAIHPELRGKAGELF